MEYFELATSGFGNFVGVFLLTGMILTAVCVVAGYITRMIGVLIRGYNPNKESIAD